MVVASVIVELNLSDELDLDSIMFNFTSFSVECHVHLDEMHNHEMNKTKKNKWYHLSCHTLPIIEKIESLLPPILILDLCHLLSVCIIQDDINLPSATKTQSKEALRQ